MPQPRPESDIPSAAITEDQSVMEQQATSDAESTKFSGNAILAAIIGLAAVIFVLVAFGSWIGAIILGGITVGGVIFVNKAQ